MLRHWETSSAPAQKAPHKHPRQQPLLPLCCIGRPGDVHALLWAQQLSQGLLSVKAGWHLL